MASISVMLKPVSSSCNMQCEYCFYHSLAQCRESFSYGKMNNCMLKVTLSKAFKYANGDRVYLSFHGGEPLLAGKSFFYKVEEYLSRYNTLNSEVVFTIQTNGLLIDDEWCEFFKRNNCLIGISLDGDKVGNSYRIDDKGNATFDRVLNSIDILQHHKIEFNILTVVTKSVAKNIRYIYDFFVSRNYKYLQFTPCLKPFNKKDINNDLYMSGEEYATFLIELTKLYFEDYIRGNYVSIRQLDNFVRLVGGEEAFQCGMNGNCSYQFTIEADGTVFPCDFYAVDSYKLGNINDMSFDQMKNSSVAKNFVNESIILPEKCKKCKYFALCKNGCKRERTDIDKCTAYTKYFDTMLPYLKILTQGIEK